MQPKPPNLIQRFGRMAWMGGALLVAFSLALSNFGMSLGQFIMLGGFLLADALGQRGRRVIRSPWVLLAAGLYVIQLAGLWNTENLDFGLRDLRVKLPLLLLPALFAGAPEGEPGRYRMLLTTVVFGTLAATFYGLFAALSGHISWSDYRAFSPFISHIRLSLLIVFSCCILAERLLSSKSGKIKLLLTTGILWLLLYLFLLGSLTGFSILGLLVLFAVAGLALSTSKPVIRITAAGLFVLILSTGVYGYYQVFVAPLEQGFPNAATLRSQTPRGYFYSHDLSRVDTEQGRFVWVEYSEVEIDSAWRIRSKTLLWEPDQAGNIRLATLLRYLTWLGYSKDADGIAKLTDKDILNIESGFATPEHAHSMARIGLRMKELAREVRIYHLTGWANGHTFAQRLEYRKAALELIRLHPFCGVGTGDLPEAFAAAYERIGSSLYPELRLRAHNQYLSVAVANGLPAGLYLCAMLAVFALLMNRHQNRIGLAFLVISACSFLTEDTLETQAGVTFFCFLLGLLAISRNPEPTSSLRCKARLCFFHH